MTVIILTNCPPKLRGDLTKWLLEINTGVYVGKISARVREELWVRICDNVKTGRATMVFPAPNEQHMDFLVHNTTWEPVDFDGIKLIRRPTPFLSSGETSSRESLPQNFSNAAKQQIAKRSALKRLHQKEDVYVVVDVETTGFDPNVDEIIEMAALRIVNGDVDAEFQSLVRCKNTLSDSIVALTRITLDEINEKGTSLPEAMIQFMEFVGGYPIVCHNAAFDQKFLLAACRICGFSPPRNRFIDTLQLARRKVRMLPNYKLSTLASHFSLAASQKHRALDDCYLTFSLYVKLNEL